MRKATVNASTMQKKNEQER